MFRRIVRISDVVDRFLRQPFWFFPYNFLDFSSDTIEKQVIVEFSRYRFKSNIFVLQSHFEVTYFGKGENSVIFLFLIDSIS